MRPLNHPNYELTIIDSGLLVERLATELRSLSLDLKRSWPRLDADPVGERSETLPLALCIEVHSRPHPSSLDLSAVFCVDLPVAAASLITLAGLKMR